MPSKCEKCGQELVIGSWPYCPHHFTFDFSDLAKDWKKIANSDAAMLYYAGDVILSKPKSLGETWGNVVKKDEKRHRYEFIGGTSKKFWEVVEPYEFNGSWAVKVYFGRIGTEGQTNIKVCWSATAAKQYYDRKIDEKLKKGYKYVSFISPKAAPPKPVGKPHAPVAIPMTNAAQLQAELQAEIKKQSGVQDWNVPSSSKNPIFKKKPWTMDEDVPYLDKSECAHTKLTKVKEGTWKCPACATVIEFDKPSQTQGKAVVEAAQVRRFIDMSALKGD